MKSALLAAVMTMTALAACSDGGAPETAAPAAEAAAADKAAAEAAAQTAAAEAAAAAEAERARLAAAAPIADAAAFAAACAAAGVDAQICECTAKQTEKTIGSKGFYPWVWEGYVNRDGMAQMRSRKWFSDNGLDTKAQQAFADAVGTCYVTQ